MLNSLVKKHQDLLFLLITVSAMAFVTSCLPTSTSPAIDTGNSTEGPDGTTPAPTYQDPTFPVNGIFVQNGALTSTTNFSLPVDFNDSFLIRGKALSQYLRTVPNTTKFCLVGKYNYIGASDKFLVMSAKPRSFTDLSKKTTEFYLNVEPANDTTNQNDCISYNLTNTLFLNASSPGLFFTLRQLCTDCTTTVTSSGLRLYFINGEEVPNLAVNSLLLTIAGASGSSILSCSESSSCQARGYNCCLQNQCVNDGAVKPGVSTLPGFLAAQEDVRLNPSRFTVYPQFYFVCGARPGSETGSGSNPGGDPDYEASVRLMELKNLYDCLNKVSGEFSYCTLKYAQAKESMPGIFSAAAAGFNDDVNFSTLNPNFDSGDKKNNIAKIVYAGQTVYAQDEVALTNGTFVADTANDNLTSAQSVDLSLPLPSNARDANLYITYKVDGTCEKISSSIAKCTKSYVQSSSDTTSTMWHDSSKVYKLPAYADTSSTANIIVKVSGVVVPQDATSTWRPLTNPNRIEFVSSYQIYQNQTIEITYFVLTSAVELTKLRSAAQDQVNSMCTCSSGSKCNLRPIYDTNNSSIVNYECTNPVTGSGEPPANQTVYVSNKNIPHRYFDTNGVSYDEDYGSALDQELTAFRYTNNDVLKPNNVSAFVGFNEIYGSFAKSGTYVSRPAKKVSVKKDQFYDIIVNSGSFSSCSTCGSDYYSALQRIFPQNFAGQGGGYAPDIYETRRENNTGLYRADDLLFGRACFVPATMIPWTHNTASLPRNQRRNRLAAQHFLFSNGYNRDWYGFDYGSLIGSFDGVTWFSIGNQRRIKAMTRKLYLAVNAYVGDLNVDSNFNVLISETTPFSSDIPDHDLETDGAQCQKSHFCSNDNDCFTQLGYDYTCQSVTSLTTNWPQFDANASEVVGTSLRSLLSLVGGSNGQSKRCVYRGRGTPCIQDLNLANAPDNFNGSTVLGNLMCSPNNSCVAITSNKFNDRIARFAKSPLAQNIANAASTMSDTVGLGARIILRPFDYYGTKSLPSEASPSLAFNNVKAICVPGKNLDTPTNNLALNQSHPASRINSSDKILGVGRTSGVSSSPRALNACPATDASGKTLQVSTDNLGDLSSSLSKYTIAQNLSSNLLDVAPLTSQNIFSSTNGSQVTSVGYQKNTCLRAPGASCFSDFECAPSRFIASRATSSGLELALNEPEARYWSEELVCGNPDFKYVSSGVLNSTFDLKKNRCCREFGKTFTVFTQKENTNTFRWCSNTNVVDVAGVTKNIASTDRYSRVHSAYDKMTCDRMNPDTSKTFALSLAAPNDNDRLTQVLKKQYETLDTVNSRTCCTGNWVRSFSEDNGGGHAFDRDKMQNIDKGMFKNISWAPDNDTVTSDPEDFACEPDQIQNDSCELITLLPNDEEKYLTWAGSLELVGIPQVAIMGNDQIYQIVDDNQDAAVPNTPLVDQDGPIMKDVNTANPDFNDGTYKYYSATNYKELNMSVEATNTNPNNMKRVFSESEFNCCIPSGQQIPQTSTSSQCCTGFAIDQGGPKRCCLPDFTNVSVYLNRYVSSEGRGLPDSSYDPKTGYIKDPGQVRLLAAQKSLCCSGETMTGVAISQLPIPITGDSYLPPNNTNTLRRFTYRGDAVDNNAETGSVGSIFDAGARWNNHVYCVPAGFNQ